MTACKVCGREIATPRRKNAKHLCASCRKEEWMKGNFIRYSALAQMSDEDIIELCKRLRAQHEAACALETLSAAISSPAVAAVYDRRQPTITKEAPPNTPMDAKVGTEL